jgi:hypothetical protein
MVIMAMMMAAITRSQMPTDLELGCMAGSLASGVPAVYGWAMTRRTKTLIATIVIVFLWLPAYAIFIDGLQWRVLTASTPWYGSLLFYALAGTFWIVPIGLSLPWMYREPNSARAAKPLTKAGGGDTR